MSTEQPMRRFTIEQLVLMVKSQKIAAQYADSDLREAVLMLPAEQAQYAVAILAMRKTGRRACNE